MIKIWNEVVEEGIAFPQEELLDNIYALDYVIERVLSIEKPILLK